MPRKTKLFRQYGEVIGASFQYLDQNGHLVTFKAWSHEAGNISMSNEQYGNEVPLPKTMGTETAMGIVSCLRTAVSKA